MHLIINGKSADYPDGITIAELLERLEIPTVGTAVARNEAVVRKALYAETLLQPEDRLEIIHAVAGG